jgi:FAD dependent oxidoreductase TIGR03364
MQVLGAAKLPYRETGSLHLAYADDEAAVTQEFAAMAHGLGYSTCKWLDAAGVLAITDAVVPAGLKGGVYSGTEATVDPRQVIATLPDYLAEQLGVAFHWARPVRAISSGPGGSLQIETAAGTIEAGAAIVCSGEDFETLYPEHFATSGMTRCKLQMMRTGAQPAGWQLGPSLAAGLTLRFYKTFAGCPTLPALARRIAEETPEFDRWLIHALVSQTVDGAITLGDSHEYGLAVDIFNKQEIDDLILAYTQSFLRLPNYEIAERWYGVYAKHPDKTYVIMQPDERVRIVGSPGGSGMTLSFGVAAESIREMGLS